MDVNQFNNILRDKRLSIVCAESITAGLLASTIASVSGASDILIGSIVTYSRKIKTSILGVDPRIIDRNTAESMETTLEMAYGLTKLYPCADIYVAVTGVASEPGTNYKIDKQVGQIYVSVYFKNKMHQFEEVIKVTGDDRRNEIRNKTVEFILEKVVDIIQK